MSEKDIFERDRSGEVVDMNDPDFYRIYDVIHDTMAKLQRMNSSVMSAEEVAARLAKALRRRRSEVILTALGKVTVLAHRLFPRLTDRLTYSYIAREAGSPFK